MTELLPRTTVTAICAHRDAAIAKMQQAIDTITKGHQLAEEARDLAQKAHGPETFHMKDRAATDSYQRLFSAFDPAASAETFRQHADASIWMNLIALTGMRDMMDRTAKDELYASLCGNVPEVTEDTVKATFESLMGDAKLIFARGLARAFSDLDRRFKSHDAFKLGSRVILTNVFDGWGMWNHYSRMRDTLVDIERVFAVLDGKPNHGCGALSQAIEDDRRDGAWMTTRQSVTETEHFKVRCFKNGNAHLWFQRPDLVTKANLVLADYYGEVLPDAVTGTDPNDVTEADLRSSTGALSTDLAFYATPEEVVTRVLRDIHFDEDAHVLEPSAGEGNIVRGLTTLGVTRIEAIEVHPERARKLEAIGQHGWQDLRVYLANFLEIPASPKFTHVVMNPPFYGTHWMEHVVHAFDFLAPGGTLVAILPVTAELGQTKKHKAFRKWAQQHTRWSRELDFVDLPPESFKSSGTRVNTLILTLHRGKP